MWIPGKNTEGATVIPRITTSLSYCPVCSGISVQFAVECVSSLYRNSHRLQRARTDGAEGPVWAAENDRVNRVVLKLARCHAAFELNEPPQLHQPSHLGVKPLPLMSEDEREAFERDDNAFDVWPEVGSRAMQRVLVTGTDAFVEGWLTAQEGNYRFRTSQANGLTVKIVLREYLSCEVVWD